MSTRSDIEAFLTPPMVNFLARRCILRDTAVFCGTFRVAASAGWDEKALGKLSHTICSLCFFLFSGPWSKLGQAHPAARQDRVRSVPARELREPEFWYLSAQILQKPSGSSLTQFSRGRRFERCRSSSL